MGQSGARIQCASRGAPGKVRDIGGIGQVLLIKLGRFSDRFLLSLSFTPSSTALVLLHSSVFPTL